MLADDGGEHAGITIPRPPTTSNHDCRGPPSSNHCGRCITALHAQVRMWCALRAMHVHVLLLLLLLLHYYNHYDDDDDDDDDKMTDRKINANKRGQL